MITYEIVVISAITWNDIQQLSISLPEFTHFVQLKNWQNYSVNLFLKISQIDLKKNNLYLFKEIYE